MASVGVVGARGVARGVRFYGRTVRDLVSSLVPADQVPKAVARLTDVEPRPHLASAGVPRRRRTQLCCSAGAVDRRDFCRSVGCSRAVGGCRHAGASYARDTDDIRQGKPAPDPLLAVAGERARTRGRSPSRMRRSDCAQRARQGASPSVCVACPGADELRDHADAVGASLSDVTVLGWDDRGLRLRRHPLARRDRPLRPQPAPCSSRPPDAGGHHLQKQEVPDVERCRIDDRARAQRGPAAT